MTRSRSSIVLVLVLVAPALAGCLGNDAPEPAAADAPAPAAPTTSAVAGAPVAPTAAFSVTDGATTSTIHPYVVPGQTARAPESFSFEDTYNAEDCTLGPAAWLAGRSQRGYDLSERFAPGDAVDALVTLTFTNTDSDFAELHLLVIAPGVVLYWEEPVADVRGEVVRSFAFQFAWPEEGAEAFLGVECWYAANLQPIPYRIDVTLAWAEGVVPAGTPHLVRVSENVTELRVSGAPTTPGAKVMGHYRLFAPDDSLVGEFALNSDEAFDAVPVPEAGDYVIIVDHSEGGMLAVGANAPPADNVLVILPTTWDAARVWVAESPGPQQASVAVDLPRVPLFMIPWLEFPPNTAGYGKKVAVDIDSTRGRVWHRQAGSVVGAETTEGGIFMGLPPIEDWAIAYDHHALAVGPHTFTISAEFYNGGVAFAFVTYLRPGETEAPPPVVGGASGAAISLKGIPAIRGA